MSGGTGMMRPGSVEMEGSRLSGVVVEFTLRRPLPPLAKAGTSRMGARMRRDAASS